MVKKAKKPEAGKSSQWIGFQKLSLICWQGWLGACERRRPFFFRFTQEWAIHLKVIF